MKIAVSFPGLGIGETILNPVAFSLFSGKIEVRWYGLFITLGMILAILYVAWRAKRSEGIKSEDVIDVGLVSILLSIIGARLYYVLTSLDDYHSFWDAIDIRQGGLGVYGGILGGALGVYIVCRFKKIKLLRFYDAAVPGVMFAQVLGRWGNFFNGEAYGYQLTEAGTSKYFFFFKEFSLPTGKGFFHWLRMGLSPNEFTGFSLAYVHPTFLYECVWNLLGFLLLNLFYRKKKFNGQILLSYLAWYGFGRMFIEGLRTDSLYICKGIFGTEGIRISQLVGLLCFLVGITLLIAFAIRHKKHPEFLAWEKPIPETAAPAEAPIEQVEQPVTEAVAEPTAPAEEPAVAEAAPEEPAAPEETAEPTPEPVAEPAPAEEAPEKPKTTRKTTTTTKTTTTRKATADGQSTAAKKTSTAGKSTTAKKTSTTGSSEAAKKTTTAGKSTTTKKTTTGEKTSTAKKTTAGTTRSKGDVLPVTPKKKRTTTVKILPKTAQEAPEEPKEKDDHATD